MREVILRGRRIQLTWRRALGCITDITRQKQIEMLHIQTGKVILRGQQNLANAEGKKKSSNVPTTRRKIGGNRSSTSILRVSLLCFILSFA